LINIYGNSIEKYPQTTWFKLGLKFLLEDQEFYKDTVLTVLKLTTLQNLSLNWTATTDGIEIKHTTLLLALVSQLT